MKASNILKVVDIESTEFSPEFIKWLTGEKMPEYTDNHLKEHLWSADTLVEDDDSYEHEAEIEIIRNLLNQHDAGYFRIKYD